jgi:hypothetical protein
MALKRTTLGGSWQCGRCAGHTGAVGDSNRLWPAEHLVESPGVESTKAGPTTTDSERLGRPGTRKSRERPRLCAAYTTQALTPLPSAPQGSLPAHARWRTLGTKPDEANFAREENTLAIIAKELKPERERAPVPTAQRTLSVLFVTPSPPSHTRLSPPFPPASTESGLSSRRSRGPR